MALGSYRNSDCKQIGGSLLVIVCSLRILSCLLMSYLENSLTLYRGLIILFSDRSLPIFKLFLYLRSVLRFITLPFLAHDQKAIEIVQVIEGHYDIIAMLTFESR
jgi:hypothetical protein